MNRRTWIAAMAATLFATRFRGAAARSLAPVELAFQWKSETVPHSPARTTSRRHVLAKDTSVTLTVAIGGRPVAIVDTASQITRSDLDALLDPRATFTVDFDIAYFTFFENLLELMTRTDDDMHNLARPVDSSALLSTFTHEREGTKVDITYHSASHPVRAASCRLVDVDNREHSVKLLFEIDFDGDTGRKVVAADWSALVDYGNSDPLPPHVLAWKDSVLLYLANQTDMQRAERFRTTIASRHAGKEPRQLAVDVRDDIDAHVVTANRWGQARESPKTEHHQALLSDLLATLHESAWPASPQSLSRELATAYKLSLDDKAAMTLQYGVGHCGEHGRTSFSILRTIMSLPGNQLDSIVLCGNANIDHGFVLCNLEVTHVIHTKATNPVNTRASIGEDIRVFDLREALLDNGGRMAFVVDPYLDPSMTKPTAAGMLLALNSKKQRRRGKDTDFLVYQQQHPVPANLVVEDIRDLPFDERMALVKNV